MKRHLWVALAVLVWAAGASAGINTTKPLGPMTLHIYPDGTGEMINEGSVPFAFDGYTIISAGALLDAEEIMGIFDHALTDLAMVLCFSPVRADALAWNEMASTASNYSEVTMGNPVVFPPGCSMGMGPGFPGGSQADLTFTYVDSATGGSWEGAVIPEPGTLALLGLGAFGLVRRRS